MLKSWPYKELRLAEQERQWQVQVLWWLLYAIGWIGTSALAFWLLLHLRINLIDLNNFFGWGPWILIGVDKFGFVLLGLGWLLGIFVIEIYLRRSATLWSLFRRSSWALGMVGSLLLLSLFLQWLLG